MLPTRALTLKQPWCWFVMDSSHPSPKRLENRPRRVCNFRDWVPRGEFWIHAGKGDDGAYWQASIEQVRAAFGERYPVPRSPDVPRGGIVGRACIIGMVSPGGVLEIEKAERAAFDFSALDLRWHFPGSHAYVLADVRPVPFVPCNGMLGFFPLKPATLDHLASLGER